VFTAMCAGACVFSEASQYYAEVFKDGEDMVTYSLHQLDQTPGRLKALLDNLPAQAAIARAGHVKAMADHRWVARTGEIVKVVSAVY